MEPTLLTAAKLADALGVSLQTVYSWERRGLIHARVTAPKRYSLDEARNAKAPADCIPCPVGAERIGVSGARLHAWARKGRIPQVALLRPRYAVMPERDVPRIKAWFLWWATADWNHLEYSAEFNFEPAVFSVDGFEKAVASGQIPERYSSAHYDLKGNYHA